MKLTEAQLDLIGILKRLQLNTETLVGIMIITQNRKNTEQVIQKIGEIIDNHKKITEQDIIKIATEI